MKLVSAMCSIKLCHRITNMLVAQASHHAKWGNLGALRVDACDGSLHIHTAYNTGKKGSLTIGYKSETRIEYFG